jgi:hypothetical protein
VRALQNDIQRILATEGVISRRDHPELTGAIDRQVRNGTLRPVLPGVYAAPELCGSVRIRILAAMRWDPDAILVGRAAAWASFWPEIRVAGVTCSLRHRRRPQRRYEFTRRRISAELVVSRSGLRLTSPARTALDLCATVGGDAIDQACGPERRPSHTCNEPWSSLPHELAIPPGAACYWNRGPNLGRKRSASSIACWETPASPDGKQTGQLFCAA